MSMTEYQVLKSNIEKLTRQFLPSSQKIDEEYNEEDYLNLSACISLVHSEIEESLENLVLSIAKDAYETFKNAGKISRVILGLICYSGMKFDCPPDSITNKNTKDDLSLDNKIHGAVTSFFNSVKYNNGIKEKDVLKLVLPIGFPLDRLDKVLLADLESFGSKRGAIAHRSSLAMEHKEDPFNERKVINNLIKNLEPLYNDIRNCKVFS